MRKPRVGLLALSAGATVLIALPTISLGQGDDSTPQVRESLKKVTSSVSQTTNDLNTAVADVVAKTKQTVTRATSALQHETRPLREAVQKAAPAAHTRAPTQTPATDPPLHGTNNHGQGSVAVVDLGPSNERPQGGDPTGADAGPEEIVVGRARGEQQTDGHFHGHITIAALFGNEILGVDSPEGVTQHGPLNALQTALLDQICNGSAQQVCLSVLTADSSTTATGSTNDFAVARAQLGGPTGIGVGAAESHGTITQDANCQTSTSTAKTANVSAGGGAVANAANSSSTSTSCRGQDPKVTNTSQVLGLGGTNLPIPAPGCADGTPDTVTGIPALLPIICNADAIAGASGVREALDVYLLSVGATSLTKETTGASESMSTAPAGGETGPQCSDGIDNDGDGLIDAADPGCHSDNNPNNPSSYNPSDNSEADNGPLGGQGNKNNNGTNKGSSNKGNGNNGGGPNTGSGNKVQCADGVDNDGDGLIDAKDPGCHTDGNANNPASYNPNDNSEGPNGGASRASTLPFTGSDVLELAIAALLLMGGGLILRRRGEMLSGK
jgi:hypothetical protein